MSIIDDANKVPFHVLMSGLKNAPMQLRCPFHKEKHERGDVHKSARYYPDSNKIHCFGCCKQWTPVSLLVDKLGITRVEAAKQIIDRTQRHNVSDRKDSLLSRLRTTLKKKPDVNRYKILFSVVCNRATKDYVLSSEEEFRLSGGPPYDMVEETALALDCFIDECTDSVANHEIEQKVK